MSGTLLLVLFAVGAVVVLVVGFVMEQKRRERLMQFALNRGWQFTGEVPGLVDRWPGEPFGHGDSRRARNVLSGTESGRPFTAFDYTYETHSTDSKGQRTTTTHRYTVVAVPMQGYLGRVEVQPESVMERMAGAVGLMQDIDLESEAFNRRYRVSATNPKLASDILTPRTMEYLLSVQAEAWRTCGSDLVSWAQGRLDPVEVVKICSVLGRIHAGIPTFVWKDHGGDV